jgi:hypothetical protein
VLGALGVLAAQAEHARQRDRVALHVAAAHDAPVDEGQGDGGTRQQARQAVLVAERHGVPGQG